MKCVNVEPIPLRLGGGHLCTGKCGRPHFHGKSWRWWRCPVCARTESTRQLRARQAAVTDLYYPPQGAR